MGAEDFSYFLLEKPGCYFLIGNGDGAHRAGGHGLGPCMLHNPSYDFNDELIPLGATMWVRLAEKWLALTESLSARSAQTLAERKRHERCPPLRAKLRAGAPQVPCGGQAAELDVTRHAHPMRGRDGELLAMDVVRDGDARRARNADHHQRLPRHRRLLRLGRAGGVAAGRGMARARARPRSIAVLYIHALNPYGFSWWRRVTQENVDLNRNFHDFSRPPPANPQYDEIAHLLVPSTWPPSPEVNAALQRYMVEHGERALQAVISGGQYTHPQGLFYGGANRRGATSRCATCCASMASRLCQARLDRPAHGPRPERPRRAHLRLPRRCRGAGACSPLVGRRGHVDL